VPTRYPLRETDFSARMAAPPVLGPSRPMGGEPGAVFAVARASRPCLIMLGTGETPVLLKGVYGKPITNSDEYRKARAARDRRGVLAGASGRRKDRIAPARGCRAEDVDG